MSDKLDKCQKSLSDYLDAKKMAFPRFFFLSDADLLSILGTSDPIAIQEHAPGLFGAVKKFEFGRGGQVVKGMVSQKGESYSFVEDAAVEGAVEIWMNTVEQAMKVALCALQKEGTFKYADYAQSGKRPEWFNDMLGMVGQCGSQIWWTWETEDTFRRVKKGDKHAMKKFAKKCTDQLIELITKLRTKVTKTFRRKINVMLIIDVHARDIIDKFVRDSILDEREFAWESQLRFYWDREEDTCVIRQCTGSFHFGYEYGGLAGRLVITPLTDRCYMTLTQALTFHLGGSPAGPAGTGKTETVKDLAKSMAIPCYVINCGEGLDYKAMGNIFSGLSQVGAWGCFDEFNRINIEVLSVVSEQIRSIQGALNYGRSTCDIGLGREIVVREAVGIFITMNPGYAGRTELPDNLKALFRPVTMIRPDLQQICEIMLFSEGFEGARKLALKMTTLYKLGSEQLSKQYHYDFGLRALKSVLVLAGQLKRDNSHMSEDMVLMRALRDMNMPKFVYEDVPLFTGLIADLFPGLDCPRETFPALKVAVEEYLTEGTYRHADEKTFALQVDKTIQIYETMLSRHTSMIVGPTGGGKSVGLQTLQSALLPSFGLSVKIFTLNPKAQTLDKLYGLMDPVTRDWTDGILSNLFRNMNRPLPAGKENERRWLVYDGDVDALWIENMNSVMDDNRLLTLPNGERISLKPHAMMLMETFDLQYASPATISRCGMVWVDPKDLGYKPFYERWATLRCGERREEEKEQLMELREKYVDKCIDYVCEGLIDGEVVEKLKLVVPRGNIELVRQLTNMVDALLPVEGGNYDADAIEGTYLFCIAWSIAGGLETQSRPQFDVFLKDIAQFTMPGESVFEYIYDADAGWTNWGQKVPEYQQPVPFVYNKILVPTSDNVLYTFLMKSVMSISKPLLFIGDPGTAKSVTVQHYLDNMPTEKTMSLNINFSSRTTGNDVLVNISSSTDKRTGKIYGPPIGKVGLVWFFLPGLADWEDRVYACVLITSPC